MITPEDIKLQLIERLPIYTDEFCTIKVGDGVVSGGKLIVTSVDHGLADGDVVVTTDTTVRVPIISQSYDASTKKCTMVTEFEHDRTSGIRCTMGYNIAKLRGFNDASYNTDFTVEYATRESITFSAAAEAVGALGYMEEKRSLLLGYNGITKIDDDNFSIEIDENIPDGTVVKDYSFVTDQRIFIFADAERAIEYIARRADRKSSLYIVFGPENASKDRNVYSDAIAAATAQNPVFLTYIQEVTLISAAMTRTQASAAEQQQKTYAEIRPAIRKAMYGHIFNNPDTAVNFAAVESGNYPFTKNSGYYLHSFEYMIPYNITLEQGDIFRENVSFREIVLNSKLYLGTDCDAEEAIENNEGVNASAELRI